MWLYFVMPLIVVYVIFTCGILKNGWDNGERYRLVWGLIWPVLLIFTLGYLLAQELSEE